MVGKLSFADKKQLERYIKAGPKNFNLLYSFTRNGADASIFHQLCDKKGPTVTVIYNTEETVYGGFTEKSWTSDSGAYQRDEHAFLFRLHLNGKSGPMKYPVTKPENAMYCSKTGGPIFGGGFDLYTYSNTLNIQNNMFTLNGSFNFGNSYDMGACSIEQFCNNVTTITDLEVYSVTGKCKFKPPKQ